MFFKEGCDENLFIEDKDRDSGVHLELHEEVLDISKEQNQIAEVISRKEVITEERTITVPVTREELVIEKKVFNSDTPDQTFETTEIMRIPVSEERIEVIKHQTKLDDVDIYKRSYQETEHIEETIKKEQIQIDTTGNIKINTLTI